MAITKKEIRERLSELKVLEKTHRITILDNQLNLLLVENALRKMYSLLTLIEYRKMSDVDREYVDTELETIKDCFNKDDELYSFLTINELWWKINHATIIIEVCVLDKK